MTEEVSITVYKDKGKEKDTGSTRAIDKIMENREVSICIPKKVIAELAKSIMDNDVDEPQVEVLIRSECEGDSLSKGKIIAY